MTLPPCWKEVEPRRLGRSFVYLAAFERGIRKEAARRDSEMLAEDVAEGLRFHRRTQPMADAPQ
jgi:hypothetical protein